MCPTFKDGLLYEATAASGLFWRFAVAVRSIGIAYTIEMATTLAKATRSSSEQPEGVHPGAVQEDRVDEITRLTNTVRYLGEQAKARDREFTKIITSLRHTRNQRARKKLWERGNAVAAALVALEAVYRNLMVRGPLLTSCLNRN